MYEDMTFEKIMEEMMEEMPDGIDTSEGSLIYHSCAKQAARLEEVYIELDRVIDNLYPDTADYEHLVKFGQGRGIYPDEGTHAVFKGQFDVPVEIGSEFSGDDYNYIVIELISNEDNTYKLECEDPGSEANGWIGDLMALDDIPGLQEAKLIELLVPGEDEETEESYRMRVMDSFGIKPFAGNKAYYEQEIGSMDGVGGVKVYRNTGSGIISAVIMSDNFAVASDELVADIQGKTDPGSTGDGEGIAPIGHTVVVSSVQEQEINIELQVEYKSGYSYSSLESAITLSIESYLSDLRQSWMDDTSIVVRVAGIENAIYSINGIIDVIEVKINGDSKNISLQQNVVPTKGVITCN